MTAVLEATTDLKDPRQLAETRRASSSIMRLSTSFNRAGYAGLRATLRSSLRPQSRSGPSPIVEDPPRRTHHPLPPHDRTGHQDWEYSPDCACEDCDAARIAAQRQTALSRAHELTGSRAQDSAADPGPSGEQPTANGQPSPAHPTTCSPAQAPPAPSAPIDDGFPDDADDPDNAWPDCYLDEEDAIEDLEVDPDHERSLDAAYDILEAAQADPAAHPPEAVSAARAFIRLVDYPHTPHFASAGIERHRPAAPDTS